jgi:hypothetical protein
VFRITALRTQAKALTPALAIQLEPASGGQPAHDLDVAGGLTSRQLAGRRRGSF